MRQLQQVVRRSAAFSLRRASLKRNFPCCGRAFSSLGLPRDSRQGPGRRLLANGNRHNHQRYRWLSSTPVSVSEAVKEEGNESEEEKRQRLEEKRKRTSRRIVANSVPYWLKKEPYCFERTIAALNLNLSDERWKSGTSFTAKTDLPGRYRRAFVDSIPSFVNNLKVQEELSNPVEEALDRLAQAGFDDTDFASDFRNLKNNQVKLAQTAALIQHNEEKYEKRQAAIRTIQENIKALEATLAELVAKNQELYKETISANEKKKDDTGTIMSLISRAAEMAVKGKEELKKREQEAAKAAAIQRQERIQLEQQISKLQRQIDGRKSHIKNHERGSEGALATIEELKRQQAAAGTSLTADIYQETQQVVQEALLVLCDALADHIQERHSNLIQQYQSLDAKTDLTKPHEWYPWARLDKRKIIYHGGPTNSGKTYNALQRLKQAKRGLYVGPLRLLAGEIYESLNSQGVYTSLQTGQERREFPFATHIAATVEMAAMLVEKEFDVVVIDEIQMIEDSERGFAWSRALMGCRAKEIHVCGGLEAKELVQKIACACNDDFELHQYDRFSVLHVADKSLARREDMKGAYSKVRPGDCIVAFSRTDIFAIKREIEAKTKYKCCVVYGSLPPEIRTTQAQLFNDPLSGFDILVASDAISMGLNLSIRRIIFNSIYKNNGNGIIRLSHSAVKQIAGRAGRRNSPFPEGEVTCRDPRDLPYVRDCLGTEIKQIEKAGLIPTGAHFEAFGEALQQYHYGSKVDNEGKEMTPHLHTILQEFSDMAVVRGDFFLCRQHEMSLVAKWLRDYPLDISTKYQFCMAPVNTQNPKVKEVLQAFCQKLAVGGVPGMTRGAKLMRARTFDDMGRLCAVYSEVELFIWLQNKFPPVNLMEQQAALARKESTASLITLGLQEAEKLRLDHCYVKRDKKLRLMFASEQEDSDEDEYSDSEDDKEGLAS